MIIHQPEILQEEHNTVLWSRIVLDKHVDRFPNYLWFRVPKQYYEYVSTQSDPFLISALAIAMYFGENIHVKGSVSPRLAYHLEEHMFLTRMMFPSIMKAVDVRLERLVPLQNRPHAVGMAFSGGVDSFFTLQHHIPPVQKKSDYQVTHALFIKGFDLVRKDKHKFQPLFHAYQEMLRGFNVELIPVETNLSSMILPWLTYNRFYSPVLIGSAMALGGLLNRFIVSNSWDHFHLKHIRSDTNPLSDRLFSTDTLNIEHFGAGYRRAEKMEAIHTWEPVQNHLRVCGVALRDDGTINCGRCEKCVRTMIPIYALGSMDQFKVFAKRLQSDRNLLLWARKFNPSLGYASENFSIAKKYRHQMLPWLGIAALLGYIRYWMFRLIPGFVKEGLKPFGFFIDHIKEEHAFDDFDLNAKLTSISENN